MSQVRPRLRLGGVRPQREGDVLALLGSVAVEQQVCEQRLGACRVQWWHLLASEAELDAAEQADAQDRFWYGPVVRAR
jgi:hypothetical protein